jgi:hypothetical protein
MGRMSRRDRYEGFRTQNNLTRAGDIVDDTYRAQVSYANEVLADSPVGFWRFGETSGTTAADSGSGANDGTITVGAGAVGEPSLLSNDPNSSIQFDGAATIVTFLDASAIQNIFDGGGTYECWFNADSDGELDVGKFISKSDGTGGWFADTRNEVTGTIQIQFKQEFDGATDGRWSIEAVTLNAIHHLVIVYDNSAVGNNPTIYLDGVSQSVTERATPDGTRGTDVGNDMWIGAGSAGAGNAFDGHIDEVALYTTELSPVRVLAHYNAGIAAQTDEGDGVPVYDNSFGVYGAYTNLVTNGGFETDTTGVTDDDATNTRVTSESKFGSASLQTVTANIGASEGAYQAFGGAASTEYTGSVWVKGASGTVRTLMWDNVSGAIGNSPDITLDGTWQQSSVTATTTAGSATFRFYVLTNGQQDITYYSDGWQVVATGLTLPYVETDGGTAAAVAGDITMTSAGMDETEGAAAFRVKPAWSDGDGSSAKRVWMWANAGGTDGIWVQWNQSNGLFASKRRTAAVNPAVESQDMANVAGVDYTGIARWDATNHSVSVKGAAFSSTASSTAIPDLSAETDFDIGHFDGTLQQETDYHWCIFWGTEGADLGDSDAAALDIIGKHANYALMRRTQAKSIVDASRSATAAFSRGTLA